MHTNESKYTKENVEDIENDEDGPPEHLWDNIAPSTEESRLHSIAESSEQLTEVSQQDLQDNENILTSATTNLECMLGLRVLPTNRKSSLTTIGSISDS